MTGPTNPLSVPSRVPFTKTVTTSQRGVGETSAVVNDPAWLKFNQGMSASVQQLITDDIATQATLASLQTVVGVSSLYAGFNAPGADWIVADGSAISRTTFSVLFGILGTSCGAGDGSTTFNIPNCSGPGGDPHYHFFIRVQ